MTDGQKQSGADRPAVNPNFSEVLKNRDRIYAYIVSMLPAHQDAEDVFQETCLVLWEKIDRFDSERPFLPWAFAVARNEVRSFIRKNASGRTFFSDALLQSIADAMEVRSDATSQRRTALEHCLTRLQDEQRELLMDAYSGKRTKRAIAADRNVTLEALYMQLHRLRRTLLKCMNHSLATDTQ